MDELKARAEAGEADAQYALSATLAAAGRRDEARRWLEAAAAQDHPDAVFTTSAVFLTGHGGALRDPEKGAAGIRHAATLGSAYAHCALAALHAGGYGVAQDWARASEHLLQAISNAHPVAMRMAAMVLFMGDPDDLDGAALIEAAARQDGVAGALAIRRAALGRRGASTKTAREVLPRLVEAQYPLARELESALNRAMPIEEPPPPPNDDRIAKKLANGNALSDASFETICARPNIRTVRGAFLQEECDYLIGLAAPRLARATIIDRVTNEVQANRHRTAWASSLHPGIVDLPSVVYTQRLARLARLAPEHAETLNILRYRIGEEYRVHHDFLAPDEVDLACRGQRVRTALIYLNQGFEGGETHFVQPDIKFLGAPGDVIVFDNVDVEGAPDVSARHASLPVRRGEKWLASLWFRDRPYEF